MSDVLPINALLDLSSIKALVTGKRPVLFLDYDGTLSPIVEIPDKAFMSEDMRLALRRVSSRFTTAIVTGRSTEKIYGFVQLDNLFYAGSHGFDIQGPSSVPVKFRIADEFRPLFKQSLVQLGKKLAHIPGVELEDNRLCISVHYRHVDPNRLDEVEKIVDEFIASHGDKLIKNYGKKVHELRPCVSWNKGKAVMWLLTQLGLAHKDVVPFYLGDDVSDEDAFLALNDREEGPGVSIIVRDPMSVKQDYPGNATELPTTHASYSLRDTGEVQTFLQTLASFVGTSDSWVADNSASAADTLSLSSSDRL